MPQDLPETCQVALKEWSGLCDALRGGRQILLLRKGGIAEESGHFRPEYPTFWLYPTFVHQQVQGLKWPAAAIQPRTPGEVELDTLAVVTEAQHVGREEVLDRLDPWHALTDETVRSRFRYRRPGLWVLAVRVYRGEAPRRIAVTPDHEGCKSWVHLEEPLSTSGMRPALDDGAYRGCVAELHRALGDPTGP